MKEQTKKVLAAKYKFHLDLLTKTKIQLVALKKETDPQMRVMQGMSSLPELKERIVLTKQFLSDIKDIQDSIED